MFKTSGSGISYLATTIFILSLLLIGLDRLIAMPILQSVTTTLYIWMVILGAVALLLGVLNVLWVHLGRIQQGATEWLNSLALIATLLIVLLAGLFDPLGVAYPLVQWVFDHIITPVQAALFALLAFFMVAAAYRFLRLGRTGAIWILLGVIIIWIVQTPYINALMDPFPSGRSLIIWFLEQPVMAALRGLLMGSALALLLVAFRLLIRQN